MKNYNESIPISAQILIDGIPTLAEVLRAMSYMPERELELVKSKAEALLDMKRQIKEKKIENNT